MILISPLSALTIFTPFFEIRGHPLLELGLRAGPLPASIGVYEEILRGIETKMISSLSILCILGLAVGVHVSRGQYLVPAALRSTLVDQCLSNNPPPACFLRSSAVSEARLIDADKRSGKMTPGEAYDALYKLIKNQDSAPGGR